MAIAMGKIEQAHRHALRTAIRRHVVEADADQGQFLVAAELQAKLWCAQDLGALLQWRRDEDQRAAVILALIFAACFSGLVGLVIDRLVLRPLRKRDAPHLIPMIATIGLGLTISSLAQGLFGAENQRFPTDVLPQDSIVIGGVSVTVLGLREIVEPAKGVGLRRVEPVGGVERGPQPRAVVLLFGDARLDEHEATAEGGQDDERSHRSSPRRVYREYGTARERSLNERVRRACLGKS